MYSRRLVQVLMVTLSILIATRASWLQRDIVLRQLTLTDKGGDRVSLSVLTTPASTPTDTPTPTPTESSSSSSTDQPPSSTTSPSSSDSPTPTPTTPTSTPTPTPTDSSSSSGDTPSPSPTPSPTVSSNPGPTAESPTQQPTSPSSPSPQVGPESPTPTASESVPTVTLQPVTKTETIFHTSTDSQGQTHVVSTESVVVSTPSFSNSDGSKGSHSSNITTSERNTIIGVTVGVGGAIVLAAAAILYWRLHNKRRSQEENEELITYGSGFGGPGTAEKTEPTIPSINARSPFQSTLETYHAPTQANAASNF